MNPVDEVVAEFLTETFENLDQLDRDVVALEEDPTQTSRIASVFRAIHTVKGTAGFLGYPNLEALTHIGETLLAKLRDGTVPVNGDTIGGVLALADQIRCCLGVVGSTGKEPEDDYAALRARLVQLARVSAPALGAAEPAPPAASSAAATIEAPAALPAPAKETAKARRARTAKAAAERLAATLSATGVRAPSAALTTGGEAPNQAATQVRALNNDVSSEPRTEGLHAGPTLESQAERPRSDSTVRVDVRVLDNLMNLVGELVLARNQLLQLAAGNENPERQAASRRLSLVTSELQANVMKTRMQPISIVWNNLPRVVRDVAVTCGKEVRIEMIGKEIELDRTIIEAIKDPLTHIVRNAVDHGIEQPEKRGSKARTGTLTLSAYHEGGQVNIQIADDGAGLSPASIRKKAQEKKLITPEQAESLGERELFQLIFLPGFSTRENVTNVSGRGVGMDVVKTNIEKIGGTVELASQLGQGTTIRIKIPLTLAIVPALIVEAAAQRFAIPQVNLLELVRLDLDGPGRGIEHIHGAPVYRLRGNLLPLVNLRDALRLPASPPSPADSVSIVVLQAGDSPFGLIVDNIRDTEEIVVKPFGAELKGLSVFAGATIMGDAKVALILDILGIGQKAQVLAARPDATSAAKEKARQLHLQQLGAQLLLLSVGYDRGIELTAHP